MRCALNSKAPKVYDRSPIYRLPYIMSYFVLEHMPISYGPPDLFSWLVPCPIFQFHFNVRGNFTLRGNICI